jgi:lipoprotein-releasing system permease protein
LLHLQLLKKLKVRFEFFIARRQMTFKDGTRNISGSLVSVVVFGIALCIAIMLVSVAILYGFKKEIRDKIVGFGSHIQIVNYDANNSFETKPISNNQEFLTELKSLPGIVHVEEFATKLGIIKTETDNQGVMLKGVGSDFDWTFFKRNIKEGTTFRVTDTAKTNDVVVSRYTANLLKLKLGDNFLMYFIQNPPEPPRFRKFKICGIYETSVEEIDKVVILGDIGHIRQINGWQSNQISGFEINVGNFDKIEEMAVRVNDIVGYSYTDEGVTLRVKSIKEQFPQLFDWIDLQDLNVQIILIIMLIVSGFNMISGLLILVLDRTNMIGVLKALGSTNISLRQIFIFESGFLVLKGLFWGNLIGITLCLFQQNTQFFKLDPSTYYIDHIPINLNIFYIAGLNIGTIVITLLMLILPSVIISKFSPADTIRYS